MGFFGFIFILVFFQFIVNQVHNIEGVTTNLDSYFMIICVNALRNSIHTSGAWIDSTKIFLSFFFQINDFHISPASALGDHFASIMFRAKIKFSTQDHPSKECSIIMKTLPVVEGMKKDMLNQVDVDFFDTEIFIYSQVLSECARILKNAGYNDMLAAR